MSPEHFSFYARGERLEGILHLPTGARPPWPVIVQSPGWLGRACSKVSEPFHLAFQAAGFAVLHYTPRGTDGPVEEPLWIRPMQQVSDLLCAVSYVPSDDRLDANRIGLFGIGATGGGNAIIAASQDASIKAVAAHTVISNGRDWLHSMRTEEQWVGFLDRLADNGKRRASSEIDELVDPTMEIMVATGVREVAHMPQPTRSAYLSSAEHLLRYRPIDFVSRIAPTALAVSYNEGDVVTPGEHAKALFAAANGPKRLIALSGASHYNAYDVHHATLSTQFIDWFQRYLTGQAVTSQEEALAADIVEFGPPAVASTRGNRNA